MDKHEPCEHELKDTDNVTTADVHSQDQQSTSAASPIIQTQVDVKEHEDKNNLKNAEEESIMKPTVDHPLKTSDDITKKDEAQAATPKVTLHRNNFDKANPMSLPKVNCKEKIILCIDNSATMFSSRFKRTVQSIKQTSVFDVLVGALKQFIMTKTFINKQHEFSLLVLNEEAQLITRFMDEGTEVIYQLQEIANNGQSSEEETTAAEPQNFDMTGLFDLIADIADIPSKQSPQIPPPFTVRVVFVYGRSNGTLGFKAGKESHEKLIQNPYFFTDCLYIHEDPAETNNVTEIFSCLCELDPNGTSYVLEVTVEGSMSALYNAFAKLCCHPLQRQRQLETQTFDFIAD